ncbi:MAG TPA: hypothetical protein VG246_05345 [Acidimicrobiales bacterium]|nr:hypothetical protein [Acidimicrobiales bacterium]
MSDEGSDRASEQGGDSACWANLVCSACGQLLGGEPHSHDEECEPDE